MSAQSFAAMWINDGQATPVAHNFDPLDHGNGSWMWREAGTASVLGAAQITLTKLKVKGNASIERWRIKSYLPAMETVTGQNYDGYTAAPRLAYTLQSVHDFIMPARASIAQRNDLLNYARNLLSNAVIVASIKEGTTPM